LGLLDKKGYTALGGGKRFLKPEEKALSRGRKLPLYSSKGRKDLREQRGGGREKRDRGE